MNTERDWWFSQDQDSAWVQHHIEETERRMLLEFAEKDPEQLQLPLEDTRTPQEIEEEYDAFMERLEKEEQESKQ